MADNGSGFEIPISFPLKADGAIHADDLLKAMRQQIKGVADETKAYNEWLAKNAKELGAVSKAQEAAAAEMERYYATLEKMHQAQVLENAESKQTVRWTQSKKDGAADLTRTLDSLKGNVVASTKEQEVSIASDSKKANSLRQIKEGLKGLAYELPVVGSLMKLLNPYTAAVAAAAAATGIWRARNDQLVESLGGIKMPDITEGDAARIERLAEAYDKWADKMLKAGTNAKNVREQYEATAKIIENNDAFRKAFGLDTGTNADQAKAAELGAAGEALLLSGQRKLTAAGRFSSAGMDTLKDQAEAAEAQKKIINGRIRDIQMQRELGAHDPRRLYYDNMFRTRYGNVSYDEAEQMERDSLGPLDSVIGRYASRRRRATDYEKLRAAGLEDIAAGKDLLGQRRDMLAGVGNTQLATALARLAGFNGFDLSQSILSSTQGSRRVDWQGTDNPNAPMRRTVTQTGQGGTLNDFVKETGELVQTMALIAQAVENIKQANAEGRRVANIRAQQQ